MWQADVKNGKLKDEQTQWHYLHTNHLGTPYMATNKAGQKTWRTYSQAFGESIIDKASTTPVNLRFPGQYFDEETSTPYNFQRDYSPYTGRYLQSDPIGLEGGENLYAYVYNDPLGYIDPEGELPPLAPIVWTYIRCVASCTARSMVHDALTGRLGDCIPETLADHTKDCALGCLVPKKWFGKMQAKRGKSDLPGDAKKRNGAKAPGKPGEKEGFKDPQRGETWKCIKTAKGTRCGWLDACGDLWCPTGWGEDAHGSPHWDIQSDKNLRNVYPGGHVRRRK